VLGGCNGTLVAVRKMYRGRGFGRALVAEAERWGTAHGHALSPVAPVPSSRGFWAKLGYAPHGTESGWWAKQAAAAEPVPEEEVSEQLERVLMLRGSGSRASEKDRIN
jgi:GNAT superfamily N-acetyltransferase